MSNYFRTVLLLATLTAIFMVGGFLLAGPQGIVIALIVAAAINLFAWWNSGRAVLRYYKARELNDPTHPLYRIVAQLADRGGLPMPRVYIVDNPQPNAFATGRGPANAAVAATSGLLKLMNEREVAGVMAHELAHIKNRDTLIMTITATFAGAISMLANFALFFGGNRNSPFGLVGTIAMMILAPLAAMLVQMAISRNREYQADRAGTLICGDPEWLAGALEKLEMGAKRIDNQAAEHNPATAHMFIINPLHAHKHDRLFSTHPSTANRVEKLRQMTDNIGKTSIPAGDRMTGPWSRAAPGPSGPWARK